VEITAPAGFDAAVNAAFATIAHIHARMSFHEATSDLAAIRNAPAGQSIRLDCETVAVLRSAIALHQSTGGLFDVAVGRQLVESGFLPGDGIDLIECFDGTSADIVIEDDTHIRLRRPTLVDLGGIAKGYAVDRAVETLIGHAVPIGLVNAGGDLRAFGEVDWPVGLRDADGTVRSQAIIRNCALASSANLLNRRWLGGVAQTPHIGRGGQAVLAGGRTTVVAQSCAIADAMTKVAMIDPALADRLLAQFEGHVVRDTVGQEAA